MAGTKKKNQAKYIKLLQRTSIIVSSIAVALGILLDGVKNKSSKKS